MYSVLGNHKTMTHRYTVNVIHVYNRIIVHTQQICRMLCYSQVFIILAAGACPGSRGGGLRSLGPPLEIEKQKKKLSEQILSYFTYMLLLF